MPWEQNLDKQVKKLDLLSEHMLDGLQAGTDAGAEILAAAVKANAPVDTGELIGAIHTEKYTPKDRYARATRVATGPFYKRFLEFGTRKMRAYPFIIPAYVATKRGIEKAIEAAVDARIAKL